MISKRWLFLFAFWFVAINLHLLRNVSGVYYGVVFATFILLLGAGGYRFVISNALNSCLFFFASFFYVIFVSFLYFSQAKYYSEPSGILNAVGRMSFVMPVALVVAGKRWRKSDIDLVIDLFTAFVALGALTVPLQFLIGPISWFVAPSTRAGFDRFGSLFGNLTSLGIVGGLGIISACYSTYSRKAKCLILLSITLGLLMSIQKAAVVNFLLAALLISYLHPAETKLKVRYLVIFFVTQLLLVLIMYLIIGKLATVTLANFRLFSEGSGYDDYTLSESIFQRLVELPLSAIDYYGWSKIFSGVGLVGSAGVAGFEDAPMTHNFFVDLALMGGILMPILFVVMLYAALGVIRHGAGNISKEKILHYQFARASLAYIVINLPFASGVIFQPNVGTVFWWLIGLIISGYFLPNSFNHKATDRHE